MSGTYTIEKGDSFSKIAKNLGLGPDGLKELIQANAKVNKGIARNPHMLSIGQEIVIPEGMDMTAKTTSHPKQDKTERVATVHETRPHHDKTTETTKKEKNAAKSQTAFATPVTMNKPEGVPSFSSAPEAAAYYLNNPSDRSKEHPFMALTIMSENAKYTDKIHFDPALQGTLVNLGFGYCVTRRLAIYGKDRVRSDLTGAGMPEETANTLMDIAAGKYGKRPNLAKLGVNNISFPIENAVKLVELVKPDYENIAKDSYGKAWSKMNRNQQAVATYFAYKTGGASKDMVSAALTNDWTGMRNSISTYYRTGKTDENGNPERVQDLRVDQYMQSLTKGTGDFAKHVGLYKKDESYPVDPVWSDHPKVSLRKNKTTENHHAHKHNVG